MKQLPPIGLALALLLGCGSEDSAGAPTAAAGTASSADAPEGRPAEPARLDLVVERPEVDPGGQTRVTVRLQPKPGIKINRYPKIKLHVPAQDGLVAEALGEVGNDAPPSPHAMEANYYDAVDPVAVTLRLDPAAPRGHHAIDGKLTYFYCVKASGFCAPAHVPVSIPIAVR